MNPTLEALFIGPTFFLSFLILANIQRANVKASYWLSGFIFCIFLIQLDAPLCSIGLNKNFSFLNDFIGLSNFVVAPVFYFSILYYVKPKRRWKKTDYLHFLFPFLILLLLVANHWLADEPSPKVQPEFVAMSVLVFVVLFCTYISLYCIQSFLLIHRYQKNLHLYSSNIEVIDLKWLQQVSICVMFIATLWVLDIAFGLSEKSIFYSILSSLSTFLGICFIGYHALKQKEIYPFASEEQKEIESLISENENTDFVKKKLIPDEQLIDLKTSLIRLMETQKPFLEAELSLVRLAQQLDISPHLLSYVINSGFGENFYQLVNRYRIEEAQKLIADVQMNHLSLLGIAYEVGFNSKTVFNTTFKKVTGQTPSDYKKTVQPKN
ncbi:MAG: AraC family transcriptional regulator [Flavobacteriaceae bacterium]